MGAVPRARQRQNQRQTSHQPPRRASSHGEGLALIIDLHFVGRLNEVTTVERKTCLNKKGPNNRAFSYFGAEERTRTFTPLRAPAPQAAGSAQLNATDRHLSCGECSLA